MFTWFELKKHYFFHILYIIAAPLCSVFLKRADFYKAHRSEKQGVLWLASYPVCCWLAEYLKRVTEMLRPLLYCDAVSRCDETRTIKPIIKEAFVAFSEEIITNYILTYTFFYALSRGYITMSAFVIVETPNKHYSTLLKTRVWIVSGKFFKYWKVLTGCESEAPECPCKVGIVTLYSVHSHSYCSHCRLLPPRFRK